MMQNIVLNRSSRQLHIRIFSASGGVKFLFLLRQILIQKMPAFIRSLGMEYTDPVTYAGHVFMGELLCINGNAVEGTCHDHKRPVSALSCSFAESLVEVEELAESRPGADVHDPLVVLRSLLSISIRTIVLQFVGEISACHKHRSSSEPIDRFTDHLPQPVVLCQGKSGETDPHYFASRILFSYEVERHHRSVVQFPVPLPHDACGKSLLAGDLRNSGNQLSVIILFEAHLGGPEAPEIPFGAFPGRNVKIIRVHHRVRTRNDDGIRRK